MTLSASRAAAGFAFALLLSGCTASTVGGHAPAAPARSSPAVSPATPEATVRPPAAIFADDSRAQRCQTRALALRHGPELAPMTGEHAEFYALVNRGPASCSLRGYPRVALYDTAGAILPFRYVHRTSMYVTRAAPRTVLLPPGAAAYVLVAKYRCDLGASKNASTIRLVAPGRPGPAKTISASPGQPTFSYCKGGPGDPGQVVGVSPIEPTPTDAGPFS